MSWAKLDFGKYKVSDITLPELIFTDPDYFLWGYDNNIAQNNLRLQFQWEDLYSKIRAIKIPYNQNNNLVCEYLINPRNGIIDTVQINDIYSSKNVNSVYRENLIDLGFPREYDENVYMVTQKMLPQFFHILFGSADVKPDKAMCEMFFSSTDNFVG